jgi:hypothetical protein
MTTELQYYHKTDLTKYAGEWIAILKDEVIAADKDLRIVYAKANSISKDQRPFFIRVPVMDETIIL